MKRFAHMDTFSLDLFLASPLKNEVPIVTRKELTQSEKAHVKALCGTYAPESVDFCLFTSGTSGIPKLAALSFASLFENAQVTATLLGIDSSCVLLSALPPWHIGGLLLRMRAECTKARVVDTWTEDVTDVSLVPTQLKRLLDQGKDLSHLRSILIGGAPLSSTLKLRAHNLPIRTLYGMTEMTGSVAIDGKPLPGVQWKIEDQVYITSERLFLGYLDTEGRLTLPLSDGYYATGDKGTLVDGRLEVHSRVDRMIVSGGENIDPVEIQKALESLPGVETSYVRGEPCEEWGQAVVAYVNSSLSEQEIFAKMRAIVPGYKVPKKVFPYDLLGGKFNFK